MSAIENTPAEAVRAAERIAAALNEQFPAVKFAVDPRSTGVVDVVWAGGPPSEAVSRITSRITSNVWLARAYVPANATPAPAVEILKARKTTQLMDDYREAKRLGNLDGHEARRWITAELIHRIGREAVVAFEQRVQNEAKEVTIEARKAREGDIYVTRENRLYTRRRVIRATPCRRGARVEFMLADNTTLVFDANEPIVVERNEPEFATPARSEAQEYCLEKLGEDHGPLVAWNMIAKGDVVCEFKDGSIVRIGIDGRYFRTDRAALAAHTEAQGVAIAALGKRMGPLLEYMPRASGDVLLQFQSGRIFLMGQDGHCVPAPRSSLTRNSGPTR
jgi:hypothetical protein